MNKRNVLLIAFVSIMLAGLAHADISSTPPSRKASVIIPMLAHYSPKDTSKDSVLDDLESVLGKYDNDDSGGQDGGFWSFYSYRLDDGTEVIVEFMSKSDPDDLGLAMIMVQYPNGKILQLGGISLTVQTAHGRRLLPG